MEEYKAGGQVQKGEITAFLSLVFLLILSFLGAMVESASIQVLKNYKRADTILAVESVFAVKNGTNGTVTFFFHCLITMPASETSPVRKNAVVATSNILIPPRYIPIFPRSQLSPYPIAWFVYLLMSQNIAPINAPPAIPAISCLIKIKRIIITVRLIMISSTVGIFFVRRSLILHQSKNKSIIKSSILHIFYTLLFQKLRIKALHIPFVLVCCTKVIHDIDYPYL